MPFSPSKLKAAATGADLGQPPPPGFYLADLVDGGAFTSRQEVDWAKMTFSVASGHLQGHQWDVLYPLEDDHPRFPIAARELVAIGVDLDRVADLGELEDAIRGRAGRRFEIEVERNGKYVNTIVKAEDRQTQMDVPIDDRDLPERGNAPTAQEDDEDIPF